MHFTLRISLAVLLTASSLGALAATPAAGCDGTQQDRRACQREAGAAAQAARHGGLSSASTATYEQNALARCQRQPPDERMACENRVRGTGQTEIEGSVMGGGVLRETTTPTR